MKLSSHVGSKGPKHECPDYVSAGPDSCHFDSSHTSIWKIYCLNVTAVTAHGNYTSQEHCLDVAEIGKRRRVDSKLYIEECVMCC